jgi:hypothetical protein
VNTEAFETIDDSNTTANVELRFGDGLKEKLLYDRTNSRFQLSRGLLVNGNLTATGALSIKQNMSGASLTVMGGNSYFLGKLGIGKSGTPNTKLEVVGTLSGSSVIATDTFAGAGLSSCSSSTSKLLWNSVTKTFSCGTDLNGSGGTLIVKKKTSNQTVTNSTVLVEDSDQSFQMGASETWIFRFSMDVFEATSTPGLRATISAPTGSTCRAGIYDVDNAISGAVQSSCGAVMLGVSLTAVTTPLESFGFITTGSTSGSGALRWAQNNATSGAPTTMLSGSFLMAFKATGSDLAEVYQTRDPSVLPGTVVSIDPSVIAGVRKSDKPYDLAVLGVISTKPGKTIGGDDLDGSGIPVFLALMGRVPVMVSAENGPIHPGDLLTSSSTPGVAMKASHAGAIIGQALTGFEGKGISVVTVFLKNPVGESVPFDLVRP